MESHSDSDSHKHKSLDLMRMVVTVVTLVLSLGIIAEGRDVAALESNPSTIPAKYDGLIRRPRVCPVDSSLVAFEVARDASVQLHIYSTATLREVELQPPSPADDSELPQNAVKNNYFDWLPVANGNGIWAAFASDVTGTSELYLYEVKTNKYFLVSNRSDSTSHGEKIDLAWSPDGRVLAYSSNERGEFGIYVLRGMDKLLKDPSNVKNIPDHELCVTGHGDARSPVWAPCKGCGYLAYTRLDKQTDRSRIFIADPKSTDKPSVAYSMTDAHSEFGYFAPAWSPDARRLAFFQYAVGADDWKLSSESAGEHYALAVYRVEKVPGRGELRLVPELAGKSVTKDGVLRVARNNALFQPPVWLPDGNGLVVPVYQSDTMTRVNPCKVVDLEEWTTGAVDSQWLKEIGNATGKFDFPLDASITGRKLSFTCRQGEDRVLVVGELEPQESYNKPLDPLPCRDRMNWWNQWSQGKTSHSPFLKVTRALVNPIWGPKYLLINRPIVPIAGVAIWLATRHSSPPAARDWSIPDLPSNSVVRGFHLTMRF